MLHGASSAHVVHVDAPRLDVGRAPRERVGCRRNPADRHRHHLGESGDSPVTREIDDIELFEDVGVHLEMMEIGLPDLGDAADSLRCNLREVGAGQHPEIAERNDTCVQDVVAGGKIASVANGSGER